MKYTITRNGFGWSILFGESAMRHGWFLRKITAMRIASWLEGAYLDGKLLQEAGPTRACAASRDGGTAGGGKSDA